MNNPLQKMTNEELWTGVGAALVARAAQALDRAPLKDSVAVPETIDPA